MLYLKLFWFLTLLSFVCGDANGNGGLDIKQENKIIPELIFGRFTSEEGLPDNRIRTIFQDSRGYLWLGTMNGLARYDGYTFKKFDANQKRNSISGNWAYAICEDASNNLWFGTSSGLNLFDAKKETFKTYAHIPGDNNSLFNNQITSLIADKSGKIWIGTEDGLANFNPSSGKFRTINKPPFNTNICKIITSYGDYIWIATRHGIAHYNVVTDHYDYYPSTIKPNIYGDTFWSLYEDNKHLYIATTSSGIIRLPYNPATKQYGAFEYLNTFSNTKDHLANDEIFDLCKSPSGDFWLATSRGLAKIQNLGTSQSKLDFYINNPINNKSLSDNSVYQVFIDKNSILWCGTELGLNKLDLNLVPFQYYTFNDPNTKDQIRSLYTKDGDNIWVGTATNGTFKYHLPTNKTTAYQFNPSPSRFNFNRNRSTFIDQDNNLWFGSLGGAITFPAKKPMQYQKTLLGIGVYTYLQDSKQNIWIGTNSGLIKQKKDGTRTTYTETSKGRNKLSGYFIRSLYEDHRGNIWIGFETSGLSVYLPDQDIFLNVSQHKEDGQVLGRSISSIVEYPKNVFWVGSESGLNRIELKEAADKTYQFKVKNYTVANGLPDNAISGIIADDQQNLWVSTIKGLLRFDTKTEQFHNFLPALNFTFSCAYKFSENKFLFGTTDGFVVFDPHDIATNSFSPKVLISDLKLFNKDVSVDSVFNGDVILDQTIASTKEVIFGYQNNVFTIGFTGLHFTNPEYNAYAYQLDGFDKEWIYTNASNRSATYTNLDPGTYHFKIRASSGLGVWNDEPATLKIVVLNPPWKTWWAILFYILLAMGLLYIVIRHLLIQSQQKQKIEYDEKEIAQLKNLHNMKQEFFTDISHEFRTPLSLIVGPVEEMLQSPEPVSGIIKQKLQLVYRNCKSLLFLIDELVTFQKLDQGKMKLNLKRRNPSEFLQEICSNFELFAQKKSIAFDFHSDLENCHILFDPEKMEMVINNLIFNALKYANAGGYVHVRIYQKEQGIQDSKPWLCIAITDNGKGIPKDEIEFIFDRFYQGNTNIKGTGVGLSLSKSLIDLHEGNIAVESEPNVQTRFTVSLPLTYAATDPFEAVEDWQVISKSGSKEVPAEKFAIMPHSDMEEEKDELLIVDDNEEVLEFLELLFQEKYHVRKALNGMEAIDCIRNLEPDLVISDVMMPKMDGIELCTIIKSQLATCHIPVILLTAKTTMENVIEGIGTGADDYVPKPFNADFLRLRVDKLIESHKKLLQKFQASPGPHQEKILLNPSEELFIEKITNCIKDQINNEDFSVVELGSTLGMSRSNLFRKLKAITGQTPIEFIYFIRLKYAEALLLERKLNISEIAYEVGFKNPSSFSKSFKKQFGKSPSTYLNDIVKENSIVS